MPVKSCSKHITISVGNNFFQSHLAYNILYNVRCSIKGPVDAFKCSLKVFYSWKNGKEAHGWGIAE